MSERQRRVVKVGLWGASLAVFVLIGTLALTRSWAQEGGGEEPADWGEGEPPATVPTKNPFVPYAADPGAWSYEQHRVGPPSDDDDGRPARQTVDDIQAQAEQNGYPVHQTWSAYSRLSAERARIKAAEYESGTSGLGDVGVQ